MQYSQCPQPEKNQATDTRSPILRLVTFGPTLTTRPTPSWPVILPGALPKSPAATCKSVWHRPQYSIFTNASPGCQPPLTKVSGL